MNGIKSLHVNSKTCVGMRWNDCFEIKRGLMQGCGMSPWLFSVYEWGFEERVQIIKNGVTFLLVTGFFG